METISLEDINDIFTEVLEEEITNPPIFKSEIKILVSSLVSSVDLPMANEALYEQKGLCEKRSWQSSRSGFKFHFPFLTRQQLITELEACTGLGKRNLRKTISSLEDRVETHLREEGVVKVEGLGVFRRKDGTTTFQHEEI